MFSFIKYLVIGLLVLIGVVCGAGLLAPKSFLVTRSVEVGQSPGRIYEVVRHVRAQDEFGVWARMDPDMAVTETGTDGEIGYVRHWRSEIVGNGSQEIVGLIPGERVDFLLTFNEPFASTADSWFQLDPLPDGGTRISWGLEGQVPYPFNAFLLVFDPAELMGDDLGRGLDLLRETLSVAD